MRKMEKALAVALAMAMSLSVVGCTQTPDPSGNPTNTPKPTENGNGGNNGTEPATKEVNTGEGEGKVLNIYVWNTEFKERVEGYYPGYTKDAADENKGKIGDVEVRWNITPNDNNGYQNHLDEALLTQDKAAADDKIDIFLVEADYALKYTDTDYTMDVEALGIKKSDLSNQYTYTQDIMTDSNGKLKGLSWQGCPGVLIYNRDAAKKVLGSDDPAEVQKAVKDWDTFLDTAAKMKDAGYRMNASTNDSFRVFSDNAKSAWVVDGKLNIDQSIKDWTELAKKMADEKYADTDDLWSAAWSAGFYATGKESAADADGNVIKGQDTFCYFGPAWLIDFCMAAGDDASIAHAGGWGATEGPAGFSWGGTWVCGCSSTDNKTLVKDIMLTMTTDPDVLMKIVKEKNDFVNDQPTMEKMAADTSYKSDILGGQNALGLFAAGAKKIDRSTMSGYDQGCNESYQKAFKNYFDGNATYDEALEAFKKDVHTKYPDVKVD